MGLKVKQLVRHPSALTDIINTSLVFITAKLRHVIALTLTAKRINTHKVVSLV